MHFSDFIFCLLVTIYPTGAVLLYIVKSWYIAPPEWFLKPCYSVKKYTYC